MSDGVRWMFHATAMGPSYDGILEPLERLFGCRVLHVQSAGPPVSRRGGMTWIADNSIEIGEPYGDDSPVHRFLERFGGGMHSVAVQVPDCNAALERAAPLGLQVADRINDQIVFTRPGGTSGILVEWSSGHQADDPRWGAEERPFVRPPVLDVRHMAFVGALVADPVADGRHLGELMDTPVTELAVGAPPDVPHVGVDLGDCTLALYPIPSESDSLTIWGAVHDRPRCIALGLTVDDLDAAETALAAEGVTVRHRAGDGSLILDSAELPFPVVLGDQLLPCDPRLGQAVTP
jgi:hypothetical protein